MKKYWLIIVMAVVVCVSVFYNVMVLSANETEQEIQQRLQEEYGAELSAIFNELKPLELKEYNGKFLADLAAGAFSEKKPFAVQSENRVIKIRAIVADLVSKGVAVLPEENRIELFLTILAQSVSGSEFLTFEEYCVKYGGSYTNKENNVDLDQDKFPGAFYLKFNEIRDNTFYAFQNALAGVILCDNQDLFSRKYVLDFRGSNGPVEVGARLAELLFPVGYDKESAKGGLYDTKFKIPPQFILFDRIHRPFSDPKYWNYWKNAYCYTINPLFEKMLDDRMKLAVDKRFDPYTVTVKNSKIEYFNNLIDKFNATINGLKIVVIVDSKTSGAGEVIAALLKTYKIDVTIIGEPTAGNILMQTMYNIEYAKEGEEKTEPPAGKPVSLSLIADGCKPKAKPEAREKINLGVLILSDSYWHNPEMDKNCNLKNIHQGGITPDYLVFSEDGEEAIMDTVKDLLNKSR